MWLQYTLACTTSPLQWWNRNQHKVKSELQAGFNSSAIRKTNPIASTQTNKGKTAYKTKPQSPMNTTFHKTVIGQVQRREGTRPQRQSKWSGNLNPKQCSVHYISINQTHIYTTIVSREGHEKCTTSMQLLNWVKQVQHSYKLPRFKDAIMYNKTAKFKKAPNYHKMQKVKSLTQLNCSNKIVQ